MSEQKDESVTFNKLGDALRFIEDKAKTADSSAQGFIKAFSELTGGYDPRQQVTAADVVKICWTLYGESKTDD